MKLLLLATGVPPRSVDSADATALEHYRKTLRSIAQNPFAGSAATVVEASRALNISRKSLYKIGLSSKHHAQTRSFYERVYALESLESAVENSLVGDGLGVYQREYGLSLEGLIKKKLGKGSDETEEVVENSAPEVTSTFASIGQKDQ